MLVNKCLYYIQTHITNAIKLGEQKLFSWEFQTEALTILIFMSLRLLNSDIRLMDRKKC